MLAHLKSSISSRLADCARKANKEDKCKDEDALLTCMAYVDLLNPIRVKMTNSIETSEYTSADERVHGIAHQSEDISKYHFTKKPLFAFSGEATSSNDKGIAFTLLGYIELVDYSQPFLAFTLRAS